MEERYLATVEGVAKFLKERADFVLVMFGHLTKLVCHACVGVNGDVCTETSDLERVDTTGADLSGHFLGLLELRRGREEEEGGRGRGREGGREGEIGREREGGREGEIGREGER